MTTYFVGIGGSDAANGLTWANRKLTLNGAEDVPVAAGDTVYVGPGTYRETLTVDVSGTSGNIITYIGDLSGENTDGIGGLVRITGSNDDLDSSRADCINMGHSFRTFRGFTMDLPADNHITFFSDTAQSDVVFEDLFLQSTGSGSTDASINITGDGNHTDFIIRRCVISGASYGIFFIQDTSAYADANHLVENCIIANCISDGIRLELVGGVTIKNCTFRGMGDDGIDVAITAGTGAGQFTTVENCIIMNCDGSGVEGATTGDIIEDYNTFFHNNNNRTNVATGANSDTIKPTFNPNLFLDGFIFGSTHVNPSDFSGMRAIAGTSEPSDDLLGVTRPTVSAKKSRGAIQYHDIIRETGTVESGSVSMSLPDASRMQLKIPVTAVSTTFTVQARRETNYAGTLPQMIIKQPGVADDATVDTGSVNVWNELTTTLTPSANTTYLIMELVSNNTATTGDFATFFDTITVS